jgi:hypothetical protein
VVPRRGVADELTDAVLVNSYDVEGTADAYLRALTMSREERQSRMRARRARVQTYDVHAWAESFLTALDGTSEASGNLLYGAARSRVASASVGVGRADSALQVRADAQFTCADARDADGRASPWTAGRSRASARSRSAPSRRATSSGSRRASVEGPARSTRSTDAATTT